MAQARLLGWVCARFPTPFRGRGLDVVYGPSERPRKGFRVRNHSKVRAQIYYQYTKRVALQLGAEGWYFLPGPFCKAHVIDFFNVPFLINFDLLVAESETDCAFHAWASLSRHRVSSGSCADAALKIGVSEECIANALAW